MVVGSKNSVRYLLATSFILRHDPGAIRGTAMFEPNPFGKESTINIIESRPRNARVSPNARAICVKPDPKDWKAKPRLDDIDALIARLPSHAIELIDIHYNSRLP